MRRPLVGLCLIIAWNLLPLRLANAFVEIRPRVGVFCCRPSANSAFCLLASSKHNTPPSVSPTHGSSSIRKERYAHAMNIRRRQGHDAAKSLFQQLLLLRDESKQDTSTASRLASLDDASVLDQVFDVSNHTASSTKWKQLRECLHAAHYTNEGVQQMFGISSSHPQFFASCPIYLQTVPYGSSSQYLPPVNTALHCLASLFLLGWAFPRTKVESILDATLLTLLHKELGLLHVCNNDDTMFALVSLIPLDVPTENNTTHHQTIWIASDWHPNVLGTTQPFPTAATNNHQCAERREPVMYLGPDSLALVQHGIPALIHQSTCQKNGFALMDVCTGSGIQALVATQTFLQKQEQQQQQIQDGDCVNNNNILVMDINARALECTHFNFCLNFGGGVGDSSRLIPLHLIQADVCRPHAPCFLLSCRLTQDQQHPVLLRQEFDTLTNLLACVGISRDEEGSSYLNALMCNPPFVPTPASRQSRNPIENESSGREDTSYGLFSTYCPTPANDDEDTDAILTNENYHGSNGEEVWRALLQHVAEPYLDPNGGRLGLVSEFFWSDKPLEPMNHQIQLQPHSSSMTGLLFTNEYPLNMSTYAQRRALDSDPLDAKRWRDHLESTLEYRFMSPGLFFLQKGELDNHKSRHLSHVVVPKSQHGSLWTPSNPMAVECTRQSLSDHLGWGR